MRRVALVACVAWSAGCSQLLGVDQFHLVDGATPGDGSAATDAAPTDAGTDSPGPQPDAGAFCLGALSPMCLATAPTIPVTLGTSFNTDTASACVDRAQQVGAAPTVCLIAGTQITITAGATVQVTGSRPLVLFASESIDVAGTLDLSSAAGRTGAGANDASCAAAGAGGTGNEGGGGGAGGSFGTAGGSGGRGEDQEGTGGAPAAAAPVAYVRGGCSGGAGGLGEQMGGPQGGGSAAAIPGASGGAVDLVAATSITISGNVFAAGMGGGPNTAQKSGGAGGGTGGLIALEAPSIAVSGIVAANGGGGGGGGDAQFGKAGANGNTTLYSAVASGGSNEETDHGGPGGAGGAASTVAQAGQPPQEFGGGGGGGGSVGVVWVKGALTGSQISPAIQQH